MAQIYERLIGIVVLILMAGLIYMLTNYGFGIDVSYIEAIGFIFIAGWGWVLADDIITAITSNGE